MTEAQAIAGCVAGDPQAFEVLYNMHKRRVYSLCLRMVRDPAEAEDLSQEAFMQLFRKIGTFRGDSAFSTWLHRLTVNIILMRIRKKGLVQVSLDQDRDDGQDLPPREYGSEDIDLLGLVDRITLEKAIAALPKGYRTVFVLHDIEGYEHNEIARIMGCSVGNSKSQLFKARLKLRSLLAEKKPKSKKNQLKASP
ncbi:MAG: RNA polymerase sigma factor [Acidobacteriota bacterium]|nr:RNA polymerase sigma factor [Acidobacteriota bacterium]MDE2963470.1 RNA polymerase sigma factor [Acidobacteriota bacterium]